MVVLRTDDAIDTDGDESPDAIATDLSASLITGPGLTLADDGYVFVGVDLVPAEGGDEFEAILRLQLPGSADCPADVDGTGTVDVDDLVAVILAWGTDDPDADVTGDGTVDVDDLVEVILSWGPCT
jgi:hypothetical protein